LQRLKLATSNFVRSLGLPRPIIKLHPEEKWAWPWARGTPQNLGFPFNIFETTEDSDFKIGRQVGFSKAHHKIPPRRKSERGYGLGEFPKILRSPLIFLPRLKQATSNVVCSLGLPRPIIKSHPARGAPQNWGFPFNISATTEGSDFEIGRLVGFATAHHKIPLKKRGRGPGLGEFPKIWGFPFNIYAMAESIDFRFGTQLGG